jgi:hypothetical protein
MRFPAIVPLIVASNLGMVRRATEVGLLLLVFAFGLQAKASGTFLGTLVSDPGRHLEAHWIYVKGKNDVIRRVEISAAKVAYADDFPREQRKQPASAGLEPGIEIRVTASQDANGEWRASRIEILAAVGKFPPPDIDNDKEKDSDSPGALPEGVDAI